jgi:PPP family 3-phenylpropionic acid transporter
VFPHHSHTRFRLILLQALAFFGFGCGGGFLSLMLKKVLADPAGESDLAVIGFLFFIMNIMGTFATPVAGYIADRFKVEDRILSVCGLLVAIGAGLLFMLGTPAWAEFSLTRKLAIATGALMLVGMFTRPLVPLIDTETLEYLHERDHSNVNYGRFRLFASIGWMAASILTGLLLSLTGVLYQAMAAYAAAMLALAATAGAGSRARIRAVRIPWDHLRRDRMYQAVLVFAFLVTFAISGQFVFTSYLMEEVRSDYFMIGLAFGVVALPEIPLMYWSPQLLERVGNRWLCVGGTVVLALKSAWYATLAGNGAPWLFILGQFIHGLGNAAFFTGLINLIDRRTVRDLRATYQALLHLTFSLSQAASLVLAGIVFANFGSAALMGLDALLLILAMAWFLLVVKGHGPQRVAVERRGR